VAVGFAASTAVVLLWLLTAGAIIIASPLPLSKTVACVAIAAPTVVYLAGAAVVRRSVGSRPAPEDAVDERPQTWRAPALVFALAAVLMAGAVGLSVWSQHHSEPAFVELGASRLSVAGAGGNSQFLITYRRHGDVPGPFDLEIAKDRHVLGRFAVPPAADTWSIKVRVKKGLAVDCRLVEARPPHRTIRAVELG
jgi:hypothetical protein